MVAKKTKDTADIMLDILRASIIECRKWAKKAKLLEYKPCKPLSITTKGAARKWRVDVPTASNWLLAMADAGIVEYDIIQGKGAYCIDWDVVRGFLAYPFGGQDLGGTR